MQPDTLHLLHLINGRSANVGNAALTKGAERVLNEDLGRPVEWERVCWDDYSFGLKDFDHAFVDKVNASDGLIVGGAVALNGRHYYDNAGMRFDLPYELWDEFKKPVIFYGLSYRVWPNETYHHIDKLEQAFKKILNTEHMMLALRNDGTREWLASSYGIADERIEVVPDPGVFSPSDPGGYYPEFLDDRPNIIVALNDEDRGRRFGEGDSRPQTLEKIAKALDCLIERHQANIVFVPHYFDDYQAIAEVVEFMTPHLAHQNTTAVGLSRIHGSENFYGRYHHADAAISMRVHSLSPCIGMGIPMVPVASQNRITEFLRMQKLDDLIVDAFSPDLTDQLVARVEWTMQNKATVQKRYQAATTTMREESRKLNQRIATLFQ